MSGSSAGPVDKTQDSPTPCTSAEDSAPHATVEKASARSGPKNLWDEAYEALKMEDQHLLNAYERILAKESESNGESRAAANNNRNIF